MSSATKRSEFVRIVSAWDVCKHAPPEVFAHFEIKKLGFKLTSV